jgi:hypothetical protein
LEPGFQVKSLTPAEYALLEEIRTTGDFGAYRG